MAAQNHGSVVHFSLELETNDGSPFHPDFILSASPEQPDRRISNENRDCRGFFFRGRFLMIISMPNLRERYSSYFRNGSAKYAPSSETKGKDISKTQFC